MWNVVERSERNLKNSLNYDPINVNERMKKVEAFIEQLIYVSRWLLAPIYLGLSLALLMLGIIFFKEAFHTLQIIFTITEADLILQVLALVDLALVGGLIVMVMISGYENFVSQLNLDEDADKLNWLGTMDASSLKMKVAASIVAISSIHLLRIFMKLEQVDADKIKWYILIHLTFVLSAFAMGYLDKLTHSKH